MTAQDKRLMELAKKYCEDSANSFMARTRFGNNVDEFQILAWKNGAKEVQSELDEAQAKLFEATKELSTLKGRLLGTEMILDRAIEVIRTLADLTEGHYMQDIARQFLRSYGENKDGVKR